MLETVFALARYLTEKIVGRVIIAVVRFFLILMFAPESLSVYLAEKIGIPYAMQIFCFIMTVVATLILDRVGFYSIKLICLIRDFIKKRNDLKNGPLNTE